MAGRSILCNFCILCLVLIAPLIIILVTLSYVGVYPKFYIHQIYTPTLNNSYISNATNLNNSIFIDLKFKRVVAFVPIRYQDVNITLFYASNTSFSDVGYGVVPGFYQGRKKTVHRKVVVEARGLPWEDALRKISGGSTVALVVELATKYMRKKCDGDGVCSDSKPKTVVVAAEVRLDASGHDLGLILSIHSAW